MKLIISLVLGIMIGAGLMFGWLNHNNNHKGDSDFINQTVLPEKPKKTTEIEKAPTMVRGDIDNVPWQKYINQLAWAVHHGDILGDERVEAQNEINEYYRLCEVAGSDRFPFIRAERIEALRHLFQGVEHFKKHIEHYRESNKAYHYILMQFVGDGEDDFFRYACREYYQFLVNDEDDGIVGWDETRQKLADELFEIGHPVSNRGFYRYLSENFDFAVSKDTYANFQRLGWAMQLKD